MCNLASTHTIHTHTPPYLNPLHTHSQAVALGYSMSDGIQESREIGAQHLSVQRSKRKKCPHGQRDTYHCIQCMKDGCNSKYCIHEREKRTCESCKHIPSKKKEKTVCEHGGNPNTCRSCWELNPNIRSIYCLHGKRKNYCAPCGGSQMCEHGRVRVACKDCQGTCEHGNLMSACTKCKKGESTRPKNDARSLQLYISTGILPSDSAAKSMPYISPGILSGDSAAKALPAAAEEAAVHQSTSASATRSDDFLDIPISTVDRDELENIYNQKCLSCNEESPVDDFWDLETGELLKICKHCRTVDEWVQTDVEGQSGGSRLSGLGCGSLLGSA